MTTVQPPTGTRPAAAEAYVLARRTFLKGRRVEMGALAAELGVSRVTLHRWVGSRDQLVCEVIWALADPAIQRAATAARTDRGVDVSEAMYAFLVEVLEADFMRAFVHREPEIALRILTTSATDFQRRVCDRFRDMLVEGEGTPSLLAPDDLAYVIVRIGESFVYTDVIARGRPSPEKARQAIAALTG